jgi:hypothetical protein
MQMRRFLRKILSLEDFAEPGFSTRAQMLRRGLSMTKLSVEKIHKK